MEYVAIAFTVVIVYLALVFYRVYKLRMATDQLYDACEEVLKKHIFIRIDEIDGMLYAYNTMTGEFVAQGNNMDALAEHFIARFPGKRGVAVKEEDEDTVTV